MTLRRATVEDAPRIPAWRAEPSASRYQPLHRHTLEELRDILAERAAHRLGPDLAGKVQWIVEAGGEPVGWFSLDVTSREHGIAAVGYTIAEAHRRRGYATAALRALLPLALSPADADLWRLEAVAAAENAASRRVLERTGFRYEGIARAYLVIAGRRVDHARYALLRPDWEASRTDGC